MAKDYNSAKSNTSTSVKSGEGGGKALEEFETDRTKGETSLGDIEITREAGEVSPDSVTMTAEIGDTTDAEGLGKSGGGGNGGNGVEKGFKDGATAADATVCEGVGATDLLGGKQPAREAGGDHHSTRSNTTSVKSGGGGGPGKPVPDSATAIEYGLIAAEAPGGGGGKQPAREAAGDVRSQGDWGDISQDPKAK